MGYMGPRAHEVLPEDESERVPLASPQVPLVTGAIRRPSSAKSVSGVWYDASGMTRGRRVRRPRRPDGDPAGVEPERAEPATGSGAQVLPFDTRARHLQFSLSNQTPAARPSEARKPVTAPS